MTVALDFANVSKRFFIQHERPESFQERIVQLFRPRPAPSEFWALRDISFTVEVGETVGIVGRNGAGKSTLLKLATGILKPTRGAITRNRRVYAMLELGAGFHPELSGRDNIFLNGSIYGLSRARMRSLFDRIVAFAELEQFIDMPVKHYSSGMFMRLGFATAIHMEPELLIIDEILAVGDATFRRKCTDALWNLKRQGVTILFVSHDDEAVYRFCDRALLLSEGHLAAIGAVDDVISTYVSTADAHQQATADQALPLLRSVSILNERGDEAAILVPREPWAIDLTLQIPGGGALLRGEVALRAETGSQIVAAPLDMTAGPGECRLRAHFAPLPLSGGRLRAHARLTVTLADGSEHIIESESSQTALVAGEAHGPLLTLPCHWETTPSGAQREPSAALASETARG